MEFAIAGAIFAAVTALIWALIQGRMETQFATQVRLDRVAGRISEEWGNAQGPLLRGSRISGIPWLERALGEFDIARRIDLQLIRADWSLRVSEFLALIGIGASVGFVIGALLFGAPLIGLVLAVIGGVLPVFALKRAVGKRRQTLEHQLIEALVMMANSLKAGFGLLQAIDHAARELDDPIAKEFKQTIRHTQIGQSVEEAIQGLGVRVGSYDMEIVVTAILVQRNVGGNLSEILDGVAHTMRERERIRGEIKTLTAQQRLTGFIIAGIPPALAAMFFAMNPEYMSLLWTEPMGRLLVGGALVLELIGAWLIKKIVAIEV
jgi:tight adherence protein B